VLGLRPQVLAVRLRLAHKPDHDAKLKVAEWVLQPKEVLTEIGQFREDLFTPDMFRPREAQHAVEMAVKWSASHFDRTFRRRRKRTCPG
jgi:hypothetical protein